MNARQWFEQELARVRTAEEQAAAEREAQVRAGEERAQALLEAQRRAEQQEAQRLAEQRLAEERLTEQRLEVQRLEAQRLEEERVLQLAREEAIAAAERQDQAQAAARAQELLDEQRRAETERLARERLEQDRLEQERLAQEQRKAELAREAQKREAEAREVEAQRREALLREAQERARRVEAERLAALEAQRLEAERREAQRVEADRVEAASLKAAQAESARLEAERLEAERLEAERLEAERLEAERVEAARMAAEQQARREAEQEAERQRLAQIAEATAQAASQASLEQARLEAQAAEAEAAIEAQAAEAETASRAQSESAAEEHATQPEIPRVSLENEERSQPEHRALELPGARLLDEDARYQETESSPSRDEQSFLEIVSPLLTEPGPSEPTLREAELGSPVLPVPLSAAEPKITVAETSERSVLLGVADLHCHLLPAWDDGARDLETSLEMVRRAGMWGCEAIVVTPHVGKELAFRVPPASQIYGAVAALQEKVAASSQKMRLVPGAEVALSSPGILERLLTEPELTVGGLRRHALIEPPGSDWPEFMELAALQMLQNGITPILAHPERFGAIQRNPALLERLVNTGALVQITADAIAGHMGRHAKRCAETLFGLGLVALVSSDAHNTRAMQSSQVADDVKSMVGLDAAQRILHDNPLAVLAGEVAFAPVVTPPEPEVAPRGLLAGLWGRH